MNMHFVDWAILTTLILFITTTAYLTKKYTRSVADFLAADRCVGKYLLGVSDGTAALGAISIVALSEMYYKAGFTAVWWYMLINGLYVIVAMSGWVQYRFRQTRALTMAQFFEIRYSRNFRITAGLLCFVSGTLNFGIFPAVGTRFFQYFCDLPKYPVIIGTFEIDLVFAGIMTFLIALSLFFTFMGGQIAVVITDFFQGTFVNFVFLIISIFLLFKFGWSRIGEALLTAPENASLVNPLHVADVDNYNVTYFLIMAFGVFYSFLSWQGQQGYYVAAKSPHDAKMGRVLGMLRSTVQTPLFAILAVCAYTLLHHPDFSTAAQATQATLDGVGSEQLSDQLKVSAAMIQILPIGLFGAFAAVMFAAFISTHDTYLHSWGSIFIQDVFLPIRQSLFKANKILSPKEHIKLLRFSIIGVAVFIFFFSLLFNQKQDIMMYFALTGIVFLSWSGVVIIGGLYWKYGTASGAWSAMLTGAILGVISWIFVYHWEWCQLIFNDYMPTFWNWISNKWPQLKGSKSPLNAQILFFFSMMGSIVIYVITSLITTKGETFDLHNMLHHTKKKIFPVDTALKRKTGWKTFGMGEEFSLGDKFIYLLSYGIVFGLLGIFLIGMIIASLINISDRSWLSFWKICIIMMVGISAIITVWMTIGGFRNLKELFSLLRTAKQNVIDDGTVVNHKNLDEIKKNEK